MTPPSLTVIIPTRDNPETLPLVVEALSRQVVESPHVVIVVDDGSAVPVTMQTFPAQEREYLQILRQSPRGAAAARNTGARAAQTPLILFLGADIIPEGECLRCHLALHRRMPDPRVGCLGFVTWDPVLPPTPLMVFLEHGGPQNAYGKIAGHSWVAPAAYFYGSNCSLKRETFQAVGGFDEEHFSSYGWEDLELGIRLARQGFRLYYEPTARGYHRHALLFTDALARMRSIGRGARTLTTLHPEQHVLDLSREKRVAPWRSLFFPVPLRYVLERIGNTAAHRYLWPRLYRRLLSLSFYDGVHDDTTNAS